MSNTVVSNEQRTKTFRRVNITLKNDTLHLLDRVAAKRKRSAFVDRAVRYYVKQIGQENLKKQLRLGAINRAERDLTVAEQWFAVDETGWPKERAN